jgi:DNA-binding response OmpR family regulator
MECESNEGVNKEGEKTKRKLLILAVDDSPVILKSVSSVLSANYKVFTLPKPTELEKVLRKLTPDLFLLDYQMPELNGIELIPIIRSFKEHKETPIIFLTSESKIDSLTAAFALGVCDYAIKPFSPDILREKVAKHIGRNK